MAKITAWSFSRWQVYEKCPDQANYKFVIKVPVRQEEKGEALIRGDLIHKEAEAYANGSLKELPLNLRLLKPEFVALRKLPGASELQMAFTQKWEPTEWFAKDAWCRVIVDRLVPAAKNKGTVRVVDFKSGKLRDAKESGYSEQLELYSLAGLIAEPEAKSASPELWFTDHGKIVKPEDVSGKPILYSRADVPKLKKTWELRTKAMLNDTRFGPKPGIHCRWCDFSKAKSGPCRF